jgi:hypothetical protein
VLRIGDPHWKLTIEAEAGLSIVSTPAKVRNLIAHRDSNKVVEPRITRNGVSEGELESDGYPAAANQCCERSIAAKPFVARWRKARKYRVSPIFRRNLNRCF